MLDNGKTVLLTESDLNAIRGVQSLANFGSQAGYSVCPNDPSCIPGRAWIGARSVFYLPEKFPSRWIMYFKWWIGAI